MKFVYQYRTKDNKSHTGVIDAASRDAAFAALKAQGIRPGRVEEAPGFFNKLFGKGKRWLAIGVLGVLCLVLIAIILHSSLFALHSDDAAMPRRQIYGDPALMDELERTDYAAVFSNPGHRFLAHYAQPGVMVSQAVHAAGRDPKVVAALKECVTAPIAFVESEPREHNELKRIVLAMCEELGRYLANGIGTPERYIQRLNQRQNREAQIYFTAKNDIEKANDPVRSERINDSLRALGLKTVTPPMRRPENRDENGVTQTGENF